MILQYLGPATRPALWRAEKCASIIDWYETEPCGAEVGWFLVRIGFDFRRVLSVLEEAVKGVHWLEAELTRETALHTPASMWNAVTLVLWRCSLPRDIVADAFRGEFPTDEVAAQIAKALEVAFGPTV